MQMVDITVVDKTKASGARLFVEELLLRAPSQLLRTFAFTLAAQRRQVPAGSADLDGYRSVSV
jgi:hypothetical protein